LTGIPVRRRGDRAEQWLAGVGTSRPAALGNRDSDTPRDFAHGGRIIHAQPLHEKREHIARFVADEAVKHALLGDDGEVAMGAAVERTATAEIRARAFELDRFADDPDQIGGVTDLFDDIVGNHLNSTTVTPVPP
jgi:hypothetical protein